MEVDYIIVGLGLAGIAFAEELTKQNKSFVVYEDNSQNSSLVAGGMYNPVILKRFTPVWNAKEQLEVALPFYQSLEEKFNKKYQYTIDIYRIFKSIEEQNNWFVASDKILLQDYMHTKLIKNNNPSVLAPYDFGKLSHTGRIDVKSLANDYRNSLSKREALKAEKFSYDQIVFEDNFLKYNNVIAKRIVFCEGYGLKENPFFNYLPMKEAKGELITIYAPQLKVDYLIKAAVFVLPLGNDKYKVGATFNWEDKSNLPTLKGKEELVRKLNSFIKCDYEIMDQTAGIRPATIDRRPFLGVHPNNSKLAILNGLGTRGVMISPLMAKKLFQHLENNIALDLEISIERFSYN